MALFALSVRSTLMSVFLFFPSLLPAHLASVTSLLYLLPKAHDAVHVCQLSSAVLHSPLLSPSERPAPQLPVRIVGKPFGRNLPLSDSPFFFFQPNFLLSSVYLKLALVAIIFLSLTEACLVSLPSGISFACSFLVCSATVTLCGEI